MCNLNLDIAEILAEEDVDARDSNGGEQTGGGI